MCMRLVLNQVKNGFPSLMGLFNESNRAGKELLVDRLHPLPGERSRVLDLLRAVGVCPGMDNAAGAEFLPERGSFG